MTARRAVDGLLAVVRDAAAMVGAVALMLALAGCPQTSTGGPHHTPPTVEVHRP